MVLEFQKSAHYLLTYIKLTESKPVRNQEFWYTILIDTFIYSRKVGGCKGGAKGGSTHATMNTPTKATEQIMITEICISFINQVYSTWATDLNYTNGGM